MTMRDLVKKRESNRKYYYSNREEILRKQSIYQKESRKDIAKTEDELKEMGRDELGHFLKTTESTKYKMKQKNGKRKGEHVLIWEAHNKKELPTKWCVHHINENKKDNRIENLKAMPISEHTKMHFDKYYKNRNVWNKGISTHFGNNSFRHSVSKKQIAKQKCSWFNKYLDSYIEVWKLRDSGLTQKEIGKKLNLTANNVCQRWVALNKVIDTNNGRLL